MSKNFIEIVTSEERSVYAAGDSKIYYRRIDPAMIRSVQNKWTRPDGINKRTGEKKTKVNEEEWYKDMMDYIILEWEGIVYPKGHALAGKPVDCTRDNKFLLPPRVREEIWDLAESDSVQTAEAAEEEKKIS